MTLPSFRHATPAVLAACVLAVLTTGAGFREDEIQCDHAAAHLVDCCPEVERTTLDCSYASGCDGTVVDPWISIEESECIRRASCAEIRAQGTCERVVARAEALRARQDAASEGDDAGVDVESLAEVCP